MPTVQLKDANGVSYYFEVTGDGSIGNPFVPLSDLSVAGVPVTASTPVPVDAAELRALVDTMLYFCTAVLEKMPRLDGNDRLLVSHAESNPTVSIAANQDLRTLTTVTTAGALQTLGVLLRPTDGIPIQTSNVGCLHIYDNVRCT